MPLTAKLDAAGNPELDSEGNPVMVEVSAPPAKEEPTILPLTQEDMNKAISDAVAEGLKDIKGKLDGAFGERDEALAKVAQQVEKDRLAELERLKEDGKHTEAHALELATERATNEALRTTNVQLTRDIDVRTALASYDFKNENAAKLATQQVVQDLVQNEQGLWIHKSGVSIAEFVKLFSANTENEFLFKPKVNNGSGNGSPQPANGQGNDNGKPTSIFERSQADVLKDAAEGNLPHQRQ